MRRVAASEASAYRNQLGEGPLWDAPRQRLLWVDITAATVFEGHLAGDRIDIDCQHTFSETVGAVVVDSEGNLVVANHRHAAGIRIVQHELASRLNDAACDPAGRLLLGTLALDGRAGEEVLVRIETDGSLSVLDDDLALSNGLDWSPDGSLLYTVDTLPGVVYVRSYDAPSGQVGPRALWRSFPGELPDGLCVDATGGIWIAFWGPGEVRGFTAEGTLHTVVEVPAPHTTSVTFAGSHLDRLVITTARVGLSPEQLQAFPDSGRVFLADVNTCGRPSTPWGGVTTEPPVTSPSRP